MDKEQTALERIKLAAMMSQHYYHKPVLLCYSGGKDSDVMLELAKRSGVAYEVQHSHTTVDAPETVYHVRDKFKQLESEGVHCTINKPKMTMWQLIVRKKMPPTRMVRYCCSELKETAGKNRHIMTGVRWAESTKRKKRGVQESISSKKENRIILTNDNDDKRMLTERCQRQAETVTNPIIDWTDDDVYEYIASEHVNINPLYCDGFKRVGCIGCPIAGRKRYKEFARYPTYKRAYITAFDKMLLARRTAGLDTTWNSGVDVYHWWMEDGILNGQLTFDGTQ